MLTKALAVFLFMYPTVMLSLTCDARHAQGEEGRHFIEGRVTKSTGLLRLNRPQAAAPDTVPTRDPKSSLKGALDSSNFVFDPSGLFKNSKSKEPREETPVDTLGKSSESPAKQKENPGVLNRNLFKNFDLVFLLDCSDSMSKADCGHYTSRWNWAATQVESFFRDCQSEASSHIYLFNSRVTKLENSQVSMLRSFKPQAETMLAPALEAAFKLGGQKPLAIVILSDGRPDDLAGVELQLVEEAWKRTNQQGRDFVTLFFCVGKEKDGELPMRKVFERLICFGGNKNSLVSFGFSDVQDTGIVKSMEILARMKTFRAKPLKANIAKP